MNNQNSGIIDKRMSQNSVDFFVRFDARHAELPSQILFFAAYVTWIIASIMTLQTSHTGPFFMFEGYDAIRAVCIVVLIARELLFGKWDRTAFIGLTICCGLSYVAYVADYGALFDGPLFIFAARNVDFRRIAIVSFAVLLLSVVFIALSSLTPLNPDTFWDAAGRKRHDLGFAHPNTSPALVFFLVCLWVYIRGEAISILDLIAIAVIAVGLFILTNSRTYLIFVMMAPVISFCFRFVPEIKKGSLLIWAPLLSIVAAIAVFGVGIAFYFDPNISWMSALDHMQSGRIKLGSYAIHEYGIPFTARYVQLKTVIDCAYLLILVRCGIPFFVTIMLMVCLTCRNAYLRKNWHLLIVACVIALYGLSEYYVILPYCNVFLLAIGCLFRYKNSVGQEGMTMKEQCVE